MPLIEPANLSNRDTAGPIIVPPWITGRVPVGPHQRAIIRTNAQNRSNRHRWGNGGGPTPCFRGTKGAVTCCPAPPGPKAATFGGRPHQSTFFSGQFNAVAPSPTPNPTSCHRGGTIRLGARRRCRARWNFGDEKPEARMLDRTWAWLKPRVDENLEACRPLPMCSQRGQNQPTDFFAPTWWRQLRPGGVGGKTGRDVVQGGFKPPTPERGFARVVEGLPAWPVVNRRRPQRPTRRQDFSCAMIARFGLAAGRAPELLAVGRKYSSPGRETRHAESKGRTASRPRKNASLDADMAHCSEEIIKRKPAPAGPGGYDAPGPPRAGTNGFLAPGSPREDAKPSKAISGTVFRGENIRQGPQRPRISSFPRAGSLCLPDNDQP